MFYRETSYKVTNGFYIRYKQHSDLQIGRQKMDTERVYMYLYNPKTGRHEGQWVYPKDYLNKKREE